MASPIEIRMYVPLATLEQIAAGLTPSRVDGVCYGVPQLQYRVKERTTPAHDPTAVTGYHWGAWTPVEFVREEPAPPLNE